MRVIDFDPSYSTLILSGSDVEVIRNVVAPFNLTAGSGHTPTLEESGWLPNVPSLNFTGSTTYTDLATQYLFDERVDVYNNVFGCDNSSWKEWTFFVVCQLDVVPAVEMAITSLNQANPASYPGFPGSSLHTPLLFLYANTTDFMVGVYSDNLGTSNGITLGVVDVAPHLIEISADGAGALDGWLDGVMATGTSDVHPKSPGDFTIGAAWYTGHFPIEQFNGKIARVLIFDRNLNSIERTKVRNQLKTLYGI